MHYLIFCICSSVLIAFLLKLYSEKDIPVTPIILWNYPFCVLTGLVVKGHLPDVGGILQAPWFPFSVFMGVIFLMCFLVIGKAYEVAGLMLTSVMQRMSMAITLLFAFFYFHQPLSPIQLTGLGFAAIGIWLINYQKGEIKPHWTVFAYPLAVLGFSGLIDSTFFYVQKVHQLPVGDPNFITAIFFFASICGFFYLFYLHKKGKVILSPAILKAGFWIGICNFSSGYFLLEAIRSSGSPLVFPINHVSILSINTLLAIFYFNESRNRQKMVGLVFAFISIALIATAS